MISRDTLVLYPAADSHDLGPQQVDIHLFAPHPADDFPPRGGHALKATVPLVAGDGTVTATHLTHPVHLPAQSQLAPGLIEVESMQHSTLNLFCLGGSLAHGGDAQGTNCHICSPAPILLVGKSLYDNDLNPVDLFVDELQAWISIQRARARGRTAEFDRLLLRIPPFTLYVHGLLLAAHTLGETPVDERSERYWRASHTIHSALSAARNRPGCPNPMPNLEPLLRVSAG